MAPPETNFELTIEKLVYGGEGLGRLDGRVVFVPYVLPGERALVQPYSERAGILRARLLDVPGPSDGRVTPPCPYFARCGGCHYQHADYELQLESKQSILRETLRRVGKIEAPEEISVVSAEPWAYRNRAQFHIAGAAIGYLEGHSRKLCPITHCPISSPRLNQTLTSLIGMMPDARWPRFVRSLEVFTNETEVQLNVLDSERPVAKRFFEWCAEAITGFTPGALDYGAYRVSGGSFFQVNRFLIDELIRTAIGDASGDLALDLYAGVGLLSVPLTKRFSRVMAVESGASAVRDLQVNAAKSEVSIDITQGATEDFLRGLTAVPDFVLADPPRTGLGRAVTARLAALKAPRISIVACDPATLARDLPGLLASGYRLEKLTLIDLFPQTFHIETVAQLSR